MGRAFGQLLTSMRSLAAADGRIRVTDSVKATEIGLEFELDAATESEDDWRAAAAGFWGARQVFEAHDAVLVEPSGRSGGGPVRWIVRVPAVADAS